MIEKRIQSVFLCLLLCSFGHLGFGQAQQLDPSADATARVPALDSFHEVIYQIWHNAWPEKDTATLRKLLPDVEKGISEVAAAPLPGILREKKAVWEENVRKLQEAGSEYREAANANDEAPLLSAAEKLHNRFELLMRSIRPVMKELEDFHSILYRIYHYYMPENDIGKIKASINDLKNAMARLNSAEVPARLKQNQSEFTAARSRLSQSVEILESSIASNNVNSIRDAVDELHTSYQTLQGLCE